MITLYNLTYHYRKGTRPALDGVTASIPPGIHLLAGENGAGKTTLLHIIAALRTPTSGECLVDGKSVAAELPSVMSRIFLLEDHMNFPAKTIRKFAEMHSPFYPHYSPEMFTRNLADFGLSGDESFKNMSLGTRKKAQLAYVLALGVDYLLLDEPTNALDIQSKARLCKMIARNIGPEQTLIVSTHTISELENMFDGMTMISGGRCLIAATTDELTSRLAFDVSRFPATDALYQEQALGAFQAIYAANESDEPTRPDFRLLYNAMYTPARDSILNLLSKN